MNKPILQPVTESLDQAARPSTVSIADQQAFEAATFRLRNALSNATQAGAAADVADARLKLRAIAVRLRDAGFWRNDKQGLRSTVSLLWEADRCVNEHALLQSGNESA